MTKTEKIKHLEKILFKIDNLIATESSVKELSTIINTEFLREFSSETKSKIYYKNLEQTINKNLKDLEKNAKKPNNRIELFKYCVSSFKQDINREIGDLKHR